MLKLTQKISVVQYPTKNAYTRDVRCVRSSTNPCDRNQCKEGGDEHAECVPESFTTYSCSCDSAGEGYFWNNETKACENPCDPNLCEDDEHSNGNCIGINATTYSCECRLGYLWNGSQCKLKNKWSFEDEIDMQPGYIRFMSMNEWYPLSELGAKTGMFAMCSNNYHISNSTAEMTIEVNMPADGGTDKELSFYIKGTGENNAELDYDTFKLYVDGTSDANIKLTSKGVNYASNTTGWSDWTLQNISLTPGTHTLIFRYKKDGSNNNGTDRFCIDDITISVCDNDETWNGTECIPEQCPPDTCNIEHATGVCHPITQTVFECECDDEYYWNGETCVAGCKNGFFKKNNVCVTAFGRVCTGQNKCYNASSEMSSCPSAGTYFYGQDAQYAALGFCAPASFESQQVGSSTHVFDKNLGLEWWSESGSVRWEDARYRCSSGGRLPTPQEILSIIDIGSGTAQYSGIYWTSKEAPSSGSIFSTTYNAWYVDTTDGGKTVYDDQTNYHNVLCVKGTSQPNASFSSSTPVTDSSTKLTWTEVYPAKTWQAALEYCENLSYGGYTDWRLPNRNEFATIFNYTSTNPASDFPSLQARGSVWTSTTHFRDKDYAWHIDLGDGEVNYKPKTNNCYTICVRSDQNHQ